MLIFYELWVLCVLGVEGVRVSGCAGLWMQLPPSGV